MIDRLKKLFINPREYWNEMNLEPGDIGSLLVPQMFILAAIPALATFLGFFLGGLGLAFKLGIFGRVIISAFVSLFLALGVNIATWIALGYIINGLAGPFNAQKDIGQAMKLATGAIIPMWAGGILHLTTLSILGLVGSLAGLGYGAYVLYLGLPIMNGAPPDKTVGYTVATIAILFLVSIVLSILVGCPAGCLMASALVSGL